MLCSKKIIALLIFVTAFQACAMQSLSAASSINGRTQSQANQSATEGANAPLDEKPIETERVRITSDLERKGEFAAMGFSAALAVVSSPWIAKFLKYTPLVLLGIAGVGFGTWMLGKSTAYWGFSSFFRNRSLAWHQLQQRLIALREQQAESLRRQHEAQIRSVQEQLTREQEAQRQRQVQQEQIQAQSNQQIEAERRAHAQTREQLNLQIDEARANCERISQERAQLNQQLEQAQVQIQSTRTELLRQIAAIRNGVQNERAQAQQRIQAAEMGRQQAEVARRQADGQAQHLAQELRQVRVVLEHLRHDLEDMQAANALLTGDAAQNQAVVHERDRAIARLQTEMQQLTTIATAAQSVQQAASARANRITRNQAIEARDGQLAPAQREVATQQRPAQDTYASFIQAIDHAQIERVRQMVASHREWINQRDASRRLPLQHALALYVPSLQGGQARGDQDARRAIQAAQRAIVEILLNAGGQWDQLLIENASINNRETGFEVAIVMQDAVLLRSFVNAGARLHNVSARHRAHVHELNVQAGDSPEVIRTKQEILRLFVQNGQDGADCPICLQSLAEARSLGVYWCGHIYCQDCFGTMTGRHEACALCRQAPPGGAVRQDRWWVHPSELRRPAVQLPEIPL